MGAGARGSTRRRQRRAPGGRHDLSRRRPLSILGAEAGLPHAVPAAVSIFLLELDHRAERRAAARPAARDDLPWLLLGDDGPDVHAWRDERGVDGSPRRADDDREAFDNA